MSPGARAGVTLGTAAGAWALLLGVFWPGVLHWDLYGEYARCVRGGLYEDFHAPAVCAAWRGLEPVARGLTPLFVLQVTAFVSGVLLLARAADLRGRRGAAALLVLAVPPLTTHVFWVMKDSLMAACLVLGVGLLVAGSSRLHRVAALALFFAASCTRHNAIVALVPLVAWAWAGRPRRQVAVLTALTLGLFMLARGAIDTGLLHARRMGPAQTIQQHDLLAIRILTGENLLPREYVAPEVVERLLPMFDHGNLDLTWWLQPARDAGFMPSQDAEVLAQLRNAWLGAIVKHPGAYLLHRARAWWSILGLDEVGYHAQYVELVSPDDSAGDDFPRDTPRLRALGPVGLRWAAAVEWLHARARWVFLPWTWLLATCALLVAAVVRRRQTQVAVLSSSLLHMVPLFFFAGVFVPRYFLWNTWCVLVALVIGWARVERSVTLTPPPPHGRLVALATLVVLALIGVSAATFAHPAERGDERIRLAGTSTIPTNGYAPPDGSPWNAEDALPVNARTQLDFVLPGAPLEALEVQVAGSGAWTVSASLDGVSFDELAVLARSGPLQGSRVDVQPARPYRVIRLFAQAGGGEFSVSEVRPVTTRQDRSRTTLDFGWRAARRFLRHGWSGDELAGLQPFTWAVGTHACVELVEPTPGRGTLTLRVAPFPREGEPQQVSVRINGFDAGTVTLEPGSHEYVLPIPPDAKRAQTRIDFDMRWAQSPAALGGSTGRRALSVQFLQLELEGAR